MNEFNLSSAEQIYANYTQAFNAVVVAKMPQELPDKMHDAIEEFEHNPDFAKLEGEAYQEFMDRLARLKNTGLLLRNANRDASRIAAEFELSLTLVDAQFAYETYKDQWRDDAFAEMNQRASEA
jgi:hypothetical protein